MILGARSWAARVLIAVMTASCFAAAQGHGAQSSETVRELRAAVSLAQHGDEQQALKRVNRLLGAHPDFVPALKLQGALLEDLGPEASAAAIYEKALRLAPNDPELLLKVGIYRLVSGRYEESIALLRRRVHLVPHDRDGLYYLAQAYHFDGQNDLAVKTIAECVKIDPSNASALQKYGELLSSSGDNENALQWLLKARQADATLARIDFDLAVASYYSMDFPNTLKYAERAVARRPEDAEALALYAAAETSLSQWRDAEKTYAHILAMKPDDLTSLLGMGRCEVELKDYKAAVANLERVERMDPTQILAHFYLSRAYAGLGKMEEARQEAELHSRMLAQASAGPSNEDKKREKAVWAQARQLLTEGREDEARSLFQKSAVGPAASAGEPYVLVGALYLSMDETGKAAHSLNRALQIEPGVSGAHTYLGMVAMQQGDLGKAEREFKTELAHHPNDRAAVAEMGQVSYRRGRWAEAADKLAKSETADPALLYELCDSYFHLGRAQDAEVTAEALAAYARTEPPVMRALVELATRNGDTDLAKRLSSVTQ